MNDYRYSVPVDLLLSVRCKTEGEAKVIMRAALESMIDGHGMTNSPDGNGIDMVIYPEAKNADKAELVDIIEDVDVDERFGEDGGSLPHGRCDGCGKPEPCCCGTEADDSQDFMEQLEEEGGGKFYGDE